jgi:hypothetical protein
MTRQIFKSPWLLLGLLPTILSSGGCANQAAEPSAGATGVVLNTVGQPLPMGLEGAFIVEIDGEFVNWNQSGHRLAPGPHVIRVIPWVQGPSQQTPTAEAMATHYANTPVTVEVVAGRTYRIALRIIERVDHAGRRGRWEAVVASVSDDAP